MGSSMKKISNTTINCTTGMAFIAQALFYVTPVALIAADLSNPDGAIRGGIKERKYRRCLPPEYFAAPMDLETGKLVFKMNLEERERWDKICRKETGYKG